MKPLDFSTVRPYAYEIVQSLDDDAQARPRLDMSCYQSQALRTESPMSEALLVRFKLVEAELLNKLMGLKTEIEMLGLDELKKFIFYGKTMPGRPEILHPENVSLQDLIDEKLIPPEPFGPDHEELPEFVRIVRWLHGVLGNLTEMEEKIEALATYLTTGNLDRVNMLEEAGDGLWYTALEIDALGGSMTNVAEKNVRKLRQRYPEKFTDHHAQNRDLDTERKILEEETQAWQTVTSPPSNGMSNTGPLACADKEQIVDLCTLLQKGIFGQDYNSINRDQRGYAERILFRWVTDNGFLRSTVSNSGHS